MKKMISLRAPALAITGLFLANCAGAGDRYPSLAQRDAELVTGTLAAGGNGEDNNSPNPAPRAPLYPDIAERIEENLAEARQAHEDFKAAAPSAERQISAARGASNQSNNWAAAQIALADLDSARSAAAIALGDLDLLYADSAIVFAQRAQIEAARNQVSALIAEQDRTLSRLRGHLR